MAWITILNYEIGEIDCIEYNDEEVDNVEEYLTDTLNYDLSNVHWMESPELKLSTIPINKVSEYFNL